MGVEVTADTCVLFEGAGEAAFSGRTISPVSGFLMTIAELFFCLGAEKLLLAFGTGLFDERLAAVALFSAGVMDCGLSMLEPGRSTCDTTDGVRDIGDG